MLRTGQCVLGNALMRLHCGPGEQRQAMRDAVADETAADWRPGSSSTEYRRILTWFLDDPSVLCPFSVHRMALVGRELGKEVGEWFGPSTAAGAIR